MSKKDKMVPTAPAYEDLYHKFLDFLKSPMWILPIMSFVEQRSVVFDKEQGEDRLYKPIHNEFRNLVDMLIQCFCDDLGVKPQQVAQTLNHDKSGPPRSKLEWSCLEPVLAASDYNLFVHMMMRKNIELQLQALQMIEIMCGLIPSVLLPGGGRSAAAGKDKNAEDQERMILVQVMRQSKDDYEKDKKKNTGDNDNAALERAMRASLEEKERLEYERGQEEKLVQEALKMSLSDDSTKPDSDSKSVLRKGSAVPAVSKEPRKELAALKSRAMSIGEAPRPLSTSKGGRDETWDMSKSGPPPKTDIKFKEKEGGVSAEALAKRQEYLKQSRDKLLAMKREARELAFADAENESGRTRPKTAKAAKAAIKGRGQIGSREADDDVMAARRALVEKLKQEVIGPSM